MSSLELVVIALALSIDAFAVSLAAASAGQVTGPRAGFRLAFHFGLFQFLMPVLGWAAGAKLEPLIAPVDHWVAAGFLGVVAVRMLRPSAAAESVDERDPTRGIYMVTLATATSIDALAVGLSLAALNVSVWWPSVLIGVVAAVVSTLAILLGGRLHVRFGRAAERFGGVVLLVIAARILLDHTLQSGGDPLALGAGPAVVLAQADPAVQVDACMRSEMASRGIHGAQIAVMRDGQMLLERAYGRKHRDRPDPVDTHSQFRIGSTTKALTAFALMQQVEAGALELDAPITTYLPGFVLAGPGQAEAITLRHLLTHASGLHDTSAFDESDLFGPTDPGALGRWVDEQRGQAPYAPPGRFWNYSSANYMYAGHILEQVTGLSYPDYMDQRVFAPAGMAHTTLHAEQAVARGNFAYGHYSNPFSGRLEIYDLNQANNWARHPTGYANATAGDLVRFASLMMAGGGDILSPESAAAMQSRQQFRHLRADQYYGFGTFIEYYQGNEMVHHDGGAWGWSATLKWIPAAGVAVATTSNTTSLMTSATHCALSAYVAPGPTRPTTPCGLDRARWDDLVGTYRGSLNTGEAWTLHVTRPTAGGNLQLRLERAGVEDSVFELAQDCSAWINSGPGSFQAGGLGQITFIADPIEPGVTWLRHRQFVAGRRTATSPTPTGSGTPSAAPSATLSPSPTAPVMPTAEPNAAVLYLPVLRR